MSLFFTILEKAVIKTNAENEFSNNSSFSFDNIKTYFTGFHEYISNGDIFYNEKHLNKLSEFLLVLDYILLQFYDLASELSSKFIGKEIKLWPIENNSNEIIHVNFMLLLNNYYQNLFVVRKALSYGFEAQSKSLFRSNIELANLALLFINDFDFCREYCVSCKSKSDEKNKWYKLTRPSKIKGKLTSINDIIINDYITNQWVEEYTELLSKQVHFNDSSYNLANAFDLNKKGFKITLENNVSENYRNALRSIIDVSMLSYVTLLASLKKSQNIEINNPFLKFRNQVLLNMFVELLGELYKWSDNPWPDYETNI